MSVRKKAPAVGRARPHRRARSGRGRVRVAATFTLAPDDLFRARRRPPLHRRLRRRLRRTAAVLVAAAGLSAINAGGLWLVTPSVANAPELAAAHDLANVAAQPRPPVPRSFAASLGRGLAPYQRLARLLYHPNSTGPAAGAEDLVLAVKLRLTYRRTQVVRMYADAAYFGHGLYGLAAASCGYFGESPGRLSAAQAVVLAGLAQRGAAIDRLGPADVLPGAPAATPGALPRQRPAVRGCGDAH